MRRQSVAFFLGDVGFMADPKFRKLARRLVDSDDFNSAVGAYFIALASARRNGLPEVDVAAETDSRFIDDLIAVGLLTTTGFPEKAFTSWKPSRTPYPGEVSRDARTSTNSTKDNESHGFHIPSTPLPSTQLNSENEQDAREELDPLITWMTLTNTPSPRPKVRDWIDSLSSQYSVLRVDAALRRAWSEEPNPATLISRAQGQLVMEARAAERRELEDEKTRNKGKRAPIHFAPLPEVEPTPEEEARLIAEYEAAISGKGAA